MSILEDLDLHPARLIPAVGIGRGAEAEERATSALLAVLGIVPSFGKRILRYLGAPGGKITTYTEPHLETGDGTKGIPDGLIHVQRRQVRMGGFGRGEDRFKPSRLRSDQPVSPDR